MKKTKQHILCIKARRKTKQNINRALGIWKKTLKKCQPEAENVMKILNEVRLVFQVPQDPEVPWVFWTSLGWGGSASHSHLEKCKYASFFCSSQQAIKAQLSKVFSKSCLSWRLISMWSDSKAAVGDLFLPLHLCKAFSNRKVLFGVNKEVVWGLKLFLL